MALPITDTRGAFRRGTPGPAERGLRMQALTVFGRDAEGRPWHC